jgi:hypothetical protein
MPTGFTQFWDWLTGRSGITSSGALVPGAFGPGHDPSLGPGRGTFIQRYPEMAHWWNSNPDRLRRPGESYRDYRQRLRESWNRFADRYHLYRRTGAPKHLGNHLLNQRPDGLSGVPGYLQARREYMRPSRRNREPVDPLGRPRRRVERPKSKDIFGEGVRQIVHGLGGLLGGR